MKLATCSIATLILLATTAASASAQSATQVVRFRVLVQQQAVVQHMPEAMSIRGNHAAEATGSYGFASNESNQKISASLDRAMPSGSSLVITMSAPEGARSAGATTLGTEAADVVTSIPATETSDLPVRYAVRGSADLASAASEQRMVLYTVTAAP
jgi:hypothetical protein